MARGPAKVVDSVAVEKARANLPPEHQFTIVIEMFGALADPTRVRLLYALTLGELCVRELALVVGVSESAVSHQLRLLRDRRSVVKKRAAIIARQA